MRVRLNEVDFSRFDDSYFGTRWIGDKTAADFLIPFNDLGLDKEVFNDQKKFYPEYSDISYEDWVNENAECWVDDYLFSRTNGWKVPDMFNIEIDFDNEIVEVYDLKYRDLN